jgi:hypothetical protein
MAINCGGAVAAAAAATFTIVILSHFIFSKKKNCRENTPNSLPKATRSKSVADGVIGVIGNTPLIKINSLSKATGCEVTHIISQLSELFKYLCLLKSPWVYSYSHHGLG